MWLPDPCIVKGLLGSLVPIPTSPVDLMRNFSSVSPLVAIVNPALPYSFKNWADCDALIYAWLSSASTLKSSRLEPECVFSKRRSGSVASILTYALGSLVPIPTLPSSVMRSLSPTA